MIRKMNIYFLFLTFGPCLSNITTRNGREAEECMVFEECNDFKNDFQELKDLVGILNNTVVAQTVEIEALKSVNGQLESDINQLGQDVKDLENVVFQGKTPATCQELADRNETIDGIYTIKPSINTVPFNVTCRFRKESN